MNFLSNLNIYKKMNDGDIDICRLSIIGIILIVLFNDYISAILNIIILKILIIVVPNNFLDFGVTKFLIEFTCTTLSLSLICFILIKINKYSKNQYRSFHNPVKLTNGYYNAALLIIGLRIFFEGSLGHLTKLIPMPDDISQAFETMSLNPVYLLLTVCIFAPFVEEFIYRGLFLNGLLKRYSPKIAITLSALIFAIAHRNIPQGINAFLLGLLLATVYYKTRSLYLCIFMHFINNFCAQFIYLLSLGTVSIIIQSIIYILIGLYLMYKGLKGLNIII